MRDLPSGTVTFLFTDIEGSTRLMREHPRAYPEAIARHHAILAGAVHASDGGIFETVGDAVYAAFARAENAARAAVEAQLALEREPWGETGPIRVRMAIHTGDVERQGAHYYGPALYRCARLMATAHGGQIVASEATGAILRDVAPEGIGLRDLGPHRLKDFERAEHVFQLVHPGLRADFPALRSLDVRGHNLSMQRTPILGRERELVEARALLLDPATRLLTLTGPGGIGKTRLALEIAADASDRFADGVFFVSLARIFDTEFVIGAIASTLGLREVPGASIGNMLVDHLRDKRLLLVLDNFEHLLAAAAAVAEMLAAAPALTVLATSQAALRVYGEREFPLAPLDVDGPAVELFVQRARDVRPDFAPAETDREVIREICRRLDGLPLAIELAAARTRMLTPPEMLARLDRSLPLLTGGARDLPERQRTLRGAIAWSHDLLEEHERVLFRRLAVFNGGCPLDAAERVLPLGSPDGWVIDGLGSLVAKSLVRVTAVSGPSRFTMLAVIREYASERLDESGEARDAARAHALHYLDLAAREDARLFGADQLDALQRFDVEDDNLRAALDWSLGHGEPELALRLAAALGWYWFVRSRFGEARRWFERVLAADPEARGRDAAWVHALLGFCAMEQSDPTAAQSHAQRAIELSRTLADRRPSMIGALVLGFTADDAARRWALAQDCLATARDSGDQWSIGLSEALAGEMLRMNGEPTRPLAHYERCLDAGRRTGERFLIGLGLLNPAHFVLRQGDTVRAGEMFRESLRLFRELGNDWAVAYGLIGLGGVSVAEGDPTHASTMLAAATAWFERFDLELEPTDRVDYERYVAAARAALEAPMFEEAWRRGQALSLAEAAALR